MQLSDHSRVSARVLARALRFRLFATALLILCGLISCDPETGASPEITVVVDVSGLTADVTTLFVSSTLNGGQPQSSPDITGRLDQFALALPLTTAS